MSELVHCARFAEVDGVLVDVGYDVMISARTIETDWEFIACADRKEAALKLNREREGAADASQRRMFDQQGASRIRTAAQSRRNREDGRPSGNASTGSVSAAGLEFGS